MHQLLSKLRIVESKKLWVILKILIATIIYNSVANATVLVDFIGSPGPFTYQSGSCTVGNAPFILASGVTATNLIISKNCSGDATQSRIGPGISGKNSAITTTVGFGLGRGTITNFAFSEFNNDSDPAAAFQLLGSLNGTASTTLASFSGTAKTTTAFNFLVNLSLKPSDLYNFTIESTKGNVYTAQYAFENVIISGVAVPEPVSILIFAVGLAGLGCVAMTSRHNRTLN